MHSANVCLFGAPLDTGNLGVNALGLATIHALAERTDHLRLDVFDNGFGTRGKVIRVGERELPANLRGGRISWKLYRGDSLRTMYLASRTYGGLNANVRAIDESSAVLDISGGDSFADLYGKKQMENVTLPKRVALARGRPLVLLPQTYGPFRESRYRAQAARIVQRAEIAWARDEHSYDALRDLLGSDFDPARHRLGVDVAFGLPSRDPAADLGDRVRSWIEDDTPVIGLNLSGMLYNDPAARARFQLSVDYREAMVRFCRRILEETDVRLLLVPHVVTPGIDSDVPAADALAAELRAPERVTTIPGGLGADGIKHVIGQLDWFAGARMHSTIASLSKRRPTAAVAYSYKFQGVFEGCGLGHRVLDARRLATNELVDGLMDAWRTRDADRSILREHLPAVERAVAEQFDHVVSTLVDRDASRT